MYRIKYDINTAVSIGLVIGTHPITGDTVEQEQVFLPGAVLPANVAPRITDGVDNGDEHISSLVEKIDGRSGQVIEEEDEPDPVTDPPASVPPQTVPTVHSTPPAGDGADSNPFVPGDGKGAPRQSSRQTKTSQ